MRLTSLIPLLRCPRTGEALVFESNRLVTPSGNAYPIVKGKPVLVRTIRDHHLSEPERVSKNIDSFSPTSVHLKESSLILHLGSGNVPSGDSRVISCDILPCENVDVVCEAEALPFKSNCFDYVVSGAVFEHVYDPWTATKELKRVLSPGGQFRIDSAFLQSYHGWPSHYFNMTPQAMETYLVDECELVHGGVPDSATPLMTLVMIIDRYLDFVPVGTKERLLESTLKDVLGEMRKDTTTKNPLMSEFDHFASRSLAASYVVVGRKQKERDAAVDAIESSGGTARDKWAALKREYYSMRMVLMHRYHEVNYYRRKAAECGDDAQHSPVEPSIDVALQRIVPKSMFSLLSLESALEVGRALEIDYRRQRDICITNYLRVRKHE